MKIAKYLLTIIAVFFTVVAQANDLPINRLAHPVIIAQNSAEGNTDNQKLSALELNTYDLVNKYRGTHNLQPLEINSALTLIAREHSRLMSQSRKMTHAGFNGRAASVSRLIPSKYTSENLAFNAGLKYPQLMTVKGWIESPGHRQTMLGDFDLTGIGIDINSSKEYYFTQLFVLKDKDGTIVTPETEKIEISPDPAEMDESIETPTPTK